MKKNLLTSLTLVLLVWATSVSAQTTTSAVSGQIKDIKGGEIPGATVQLIYKPTNITYGSITNAEGRFFLSNLNPGGPYDIIVSFVGFKTEKQEDIFLKLGETLKLHFELKEDVQQLSEIVVVGILENASEKTGTNTNNGAPHLVKKFF